MKSLKNLLWLIEIGIISGSAELTELWLMEISTNFWILQSLPSRQRKIRVELYQDIPWFVWHRFCLLILQSCFPFVSLPVLLYSFIAIFKFSYGFLGAWHLLVMHTGKATCVKFGPDAKYLAVGSMDRNLRIFGLPGDEAAVES